MFATTRRVTTLPHVSSSSAHTGFSSSHMLALYKGLACPWMQHACHEWEELSSHSSAEHVEVKGYSSYFLNDWLQFFIIRRTDAFLAIFYCCVLCRVLIVL